MSSKFKFSLDGVDATARQFADVRRQLQELPASVGRSVSRIDRRVASVEESLDALSSNESPADASVNDVVLAAAHGGTGVRNVSDSTLSLTPRKTIYCLPDGRLGVDCSSASSVTNVEDADKFLTVEALRRVKWRLYMYVDDLNLKGDDAQPVIGLLAEDLDEAGLGFFCEYDDGDVPIGVDYPKLSVAVLRLVQESMDKVDELRSAVERLSSEIDRIKKYCVKNSTIGE